MWELIINPLVTLIMWLYAVLGNDVVIAIAVLTVIIRMLTYPLILPQQRSAKRMQEFSPQLKKLQEKYKDDKEKLSQATMQFYRENGINPLGGCAPSIIQLLILSAMYATINYALAATPYQLVDVSQRILIPGLERVVPLQNIWLGVDLVKTPYPILQALSGSVPANSNPIWTLALPILVLATTWLQFKMTTPTTGSTDPNDQTAQMTRTLSTTMPLMFGFFSLSFSVGLSVYFIVSNLVGILQYTPQFKAFANRLFPERKPKPKDEKLVPSSVISSAKSGINMLDMPRTEKATVTSTKKTPKTSGKSYGKKK
jgi:YidC/Oxa1 family membrane protein insertase